MTTSSPKSTQHEPPPPSPNDHHNADARPAQPSPDNGHQFHHVDSFNATMPPVPTPSHPLAAALAMPASPARAAAPSTASSSPGPVRTRPTGPSSARRSTSSSSTHHITPHSGRGSFTVDANSGHELVCHDEGRTARSSWRGAGRRRWGRRSGRTCLALLGVVQGV